MFHVLEAWDTMSSPHASQLDTSSNLNRAAWSGSRTAVYVDGRRKARNAPPPPSPTDGLSGLLKSKARSGNWGIGDRSRRVLKQFGPSFAARSSHAAPVVAATARLARTHITGRLGLPVVTECAC